MNYGFFDEKNKEYVITRPDTPAPWANYLGSPLYGAIISGNAGGYSFVKSGANGRLTRYRFNGVPHDQPGRYVYIKDRENGNYWSASWAPVCKDMQEFKYECRHGTAYTQISSDYTGIKAQVNYFVPQGAEHEVWRVNIFNNSGRQRKLSVTGYVEFTNESNYEQDQVNLQYTQFISRTYFKENFIKQVYNENFKDPDKERFFGLAGTEVSKYCGDRERFVGKYRGYENPIGIAEGLNNDLNYCGNSCGALQTEILLRDGESAEFVFLLGQKPEAEARKLIAFYSDIRAADKELEELKSYWHAKLENLVVKTPDEKFNNMLNVWNAYQCFITFIWSRAASFSYCGLRNGYGYRDTVQDIQGIIHLAPEMALEQIRFMLSAQVSNGAGLPLVKFNHNAGHEGTPGDPDYDRETGHPSYRADDALWLFPTIYKYITESGNMAFLDEKICYAETPDQESVYEHLKRAVDFSVNNLGNHGMPAGLHADWNDCLRLGKKGESVFVAFQLVYAIKLLKEFAEYKNDKDYAEYLSKISGELEPVLAECWNDDRWIRGYRENGDIIGQKTDPEASMWLNPQSWGIISGFSSEEQAKTSMDSVYRELNTPYGIQVMNPPYANHAFDGALMVCFNGYVKENAGIFSQPQGWAILAESLLGRGNRAYEYWRNSCPAYMNDDADKRVLEPYVHGQFTEGKGSPFAGRSHVHWLTGTASTVMVGSVEGILGLRPEIGGIVINPSISSEWKELEIKKNFRGKELNIKISNPNGAESGVKAVSVNREKIAGLLIEEKILKEKNEILVEM
ncbi:MAG: N,N'-diacetylchitobiose phosphorylase [Oscillospiraceae bacterium]|jgi:cellobiose phosphorylase|nr:N,N'-diacetylchitobiose phosphorylase [Oscillospiraceae bacterium]